MGPDALEKSFIAFANYHSANFNIINNPSIKNDFPLIYAVGKASIEDNIMVVEERLTLYKFIQSVQRL